MNGPVWVLEDPRAGTATQALGIAERLGTPFRRVRLTWNRLAHVAALAPQGSLLGLARSGMEAVTDAGPPPALVVSAGSRAAPVALWLRCRYGSRIVHCMRPGLAGLARRSLFDLLVVPEHDRMTPGPNVMLVTGAPHRLSPDVLRRARADWAERLDHLPHPRVALLMGAPGTLVRGRDMPPATAHALGGQIASLVGGAGGSVLATTSRRTGAEATEALAAGLRHAMHVMHRWGEPGENPYAGFLATADVVVVTADSVSMVSEALATQAAVHVAYEELDIPRHRRMVDDLVGAGQARRLTRSTTRRELLAPWPRVPLDEAGRVASEIALRFGIPARAT